MEQLQTVLDDFRRSVRFVDIVDVAIISVLLYAVLTWFRETTSRSVYVGISILVVVYLLARVFDLYLTTLVFQAAFGLVLIAMVVVFQEDLRRVIERLARLGTIRDRRTEHFEHLDTLVEVAAEFAAKKVGSLIVLRGREPLDRHVDRGIVVDGKISKPLLDSIFDPHSIGHDGAVIIAKNRIKQFAAHLPLSKNALAIGSCGTRHSAALGISEVTDALVIVVSEERGQISVAHDGQLTPISSPAALQVRLDQFTQTTFPQKTEELWKRMLKRHVVLKALSVVIACAAWFMLSYREGTVQQTFVVPIEFRNVPEDLVFDDPPTQVRVTLSGRERGFTLLAPSTLKLSVDAAKIDEGAHRIPLEEEQVRRPANLSVYLIEPRTLLIDAHTFIPVTLAIQVQTQAQLPDGYELKSLQPIPSSIRAMVWRSEAGRTSRLWTEPIDLQKIESTSTVNATLVLPRHVHFADGKPPEIRVRADIAKRNENVDAAPAASESIKP